MNRRNLLKAFAAIVPASAIAAVSPSSGYGYVSVQNCHAVTGHPSCYVRVWFNGEYVSGSMKILALDDRQGWIETFAKGTDGGYIVKAGSLVRERKYGHVRLTFEEASQ